MSYTKRWENFIFLIEKYASDPIEEWNHYQLLGYVLSQTSQKIEPINILNANTELPGLLSKNSTSPSRHPMVESIRTIYRQFNKCPIKTKEFLDWCLSKYKSKLDIRGLRYLYIYYKTNTQNHSSIPLRTDPLPKKLKELFFDLHLTTYGELASLRNDDQLNQILAERLQSIDCTIEGLHLDKVT